jgi:hypothetical protein
VQGIPVTADLGESLDIGCCDRAVHFRYVADPRSSVLPRCHSVVTIPPSIVN